MHCLRATCLNFRAGPFFPLKTPVLVKAKVYFRSAPGIAAGVNQKKMKLNKRLIFVFLFLTLNVSLFGQSSDWNSLEKTNFTIEYPKDWTLNESGQMGTSFILLSPLTSEQDKFSANVNLLIQDLTGYNVDLDDYVEISEGQIKTLVTNGKILESNRVTNQHLSHHEIIYTGKQGVFDLTFQQYYWVVDDKAYVLTFTSEEDQFDNYKLLGKKILNSFKLI